MKNIILFGGAVILGIILVLGFVKAKEFSQSTNLTQPVVSPVPSTINYDPNIPPSESLVGNVVSARNKILWQSREATQPGELTQGPLKQIHQSEAVATDKTGQIKIEFPNVASVNILEDSEVLFGQTLPANLVLVQKKGAADYQRAGDAPVSVRAMHLLIDLDKNTSITVSMDEEESLVNIDLAKGFLTLGYNDAQSVTQTVKVKAGQKITFDDQLRKIGIR